MSERGRFSRNVAFAWGDYGATCRYQATGGTEAANERNSSSHLRAQWMLEVTFLTQSTGSRLRPPPKSLMCERQARG